MDERIEISFNIKSNVSLKSIKEEILRQEKLLAEFSASEENHAAEIAQIEENVGLLSEKYVSVRKMKISDTVNSVFRWTLWVILVIYCISLVVLPVWMLLTSFKSASEYSWNKFGFPESWYFKNFADVVERMSVCDEWGNVVTVWEEALYSILWSVFSSGFTVFLTVCVAYVLAKYKFRGRDFIYNLGIVIMIVPIIGNLQASMVFRTNVIPTYDNMLLTIITGPTTVFSGLHFLLLYGTFKEIPWDYGEQVFIDGGNHYTAFFSMYLPMGLPSATVIFVLTFLGAWNDYKTFMMWLPSTPNLSYGLYMLMENKVALSTPAIMAGFTLIVVPTVALYLASQKLIMSKFSVGGLKG